MLQETVLLRKKVAILKTGYYYIRTTRAVWCKAFVVERSRRRITIAFKVPHHFRRRPGQEVHRGQGLVYERLSIRTILEARRYVA